MQEHLDPDRLILLALAENPQHFHETAHLAGCLECQVELDSLRHVAELGSESQDLSDLPPPPERVWQAIAAEVAQPTTGKPKVIDIAARRRPRRWLTPVLAAVAAAIIGIAGTVTVIRFVGRPTQAMITAHADLTRLKIAPDAAYGEAQVVAGDQLRLSVRNLPLTTGYYQVWLMNPENLTQMVPVGILGDLSTTVLPIAPTTDLNRYRLIDISAQAYGGDGTHSGKSLLRGTLTN